MTAQVLFLKVFSTEDPYLNDVEKFHVFYELRVSQ